MAQNILLLAVIILQIFSTHAFISPTTSSTIISKHSSPPINSRHCPLSMADDESSPPSSSSVSLEEKMKSWEASEDEIKAATLGGVVPGSSIGGGGEDNAGRTDAFDVGLYIAFPIMVISCLAFIFFPILVGNIDINSVGPPPTS